SVLVAGTPSGNEVASAGRLYSTQWTHVPRGASGSSQIRANACVPLGASDHVKGGETSLPSAVCFFGMGEPSAKALVCSFMRDPPLFACGLAGPQIRKVASGVQCITAIFPASLT